MRAAVAALKICPRRVDPLEVIVVRPSLADVPRWAVLTGIGLWTAALHVLHLLLLGLTGAPAEHGPIIASLVVWTVLTAWGLVRRSRLTPAEVAVALACGAVAITADGVFGGSPGHAYLVSAGLLALVLGISAFSARWWAVAGALVVLACQATLLLALLGTGPLALYVALTTALTSAFACLLLIATQLDLQALVQMNQVAADHDPLTGLLNRRGMEVAFARLRAREPVGQRVAAVVLDLDHFKDVNDAHGHAAGDEVLVRVADVLRARARADDALVRLGGEELAWFGLWPDEGDVVAASEAVRRAVAEGTAAEGVGVTASIGIAFSSDATQAAPDAEALSRLLVRADAALYEAKRSGRDRIVLSPRHDGAPALQVRDGGSGGAGAEAQRA